MPVSDLQTNGPEVIPQFLNTKDFAKLMKCSLKTAQRIFRTNRTIMVGKVRRMTFAQFKRQFLDKEGVNP